MTPADLTAKARRASEWLKARDTVKFYPEIRKGSQVGWLIQALNTGVYFERTDREFIAFCEDRGWQDQVQEDDGVEWVTVAEECEIGSYTIIVDKQSEWTWTLLETANMEPGTDGGWVDSGTAPTREEARRQAVEAARALGKEGGKE